jgi:hypothetical protein
MLFLWTIALFFPLLWGLGLASASTLAGAFTVLVVVTLALFLIRVIQGDRRRHRR